ncbi:MAG TPA: Ig-like domain-containing protein, partial [Chitinophagales bacterium]|nr:Ig-like domain-containing protein [Chitinophagales bacterium]
MISNTPLYAGLSSLNGAAATGVSVMLFVNDGLVATTTAAGGTYSFTGLSNIKANDVVSVRAIASGNSCVSAAATATVQCHLTVPLINANTSNQITAGTFITGVSSAGAGATINIYNSSNALLGSATVSASGTFTTGISALAGTSYYAQAVTTCGTSSSSATVSALAGVSSARCGSITAATITTTSTAVNGTLSSSVANTTVTLYLDSVAIGSVLTSGTTWSIAVNTTYTNKLYSGGKITMGVTEAGKQEVMCASAATVPCPTNAMPAVSPSNVMMSIAESVTYALSTTAAGVLYTLEDATSFSDWAVSRLGTGSGMTIGTYAFPNTGTYSLRMKGTSFDGMGCDATANVSVSVINKPPVANNLFAPRMNSCADTTVLPSLTAGDPDGTIASYKITSLPTGAAGVLYLCNPSCNAVALNDMIPAGDASKLKFDPSPSFTGSVSFTYAATDNLGLEGNNAMYAIGVYNNPPAANNVLSQKLAYINAPIQLPPFSGFDADGTVVSYTVLNIPSGQQGTLYFCNPNCTAVPVGKVVQAVNGGKFMFAPAADFAGYAEFNYAATDNNGSISEPAVYIIPVGLTEENLPPVSERIESHSIHNNAGQTTIPPLYGLDIDGVVSSYSILSLPAPEHGTLYLCNPSCIVVTDNQTIYAGEEEFLKFSPNLSFMGTAYFTYAARDDDGTLGNTARYEIPVLNNAPVANPVTTQFVSNAALQNSIPSLTGYDRDGSVSHFNITSLPSAAAGTLYFCNPSCGVAIAGQTIIPADAAKLRFEPVPGFTGEAMFTYTATDNNGNVSSDSRYTIPVNTFSYGNGIPPVTNNVTNAPIANMASATAITALSATDADGAVTGYVIHSVPSPYQGSLQLCNPACAGVAVGQTVSAANAANLRFLPTPGYRGNTIFRYAARDDKGNLGNLATYSIPVSADLPTAFNAVSVVLNVNDGAMSIATLSGAGPSGTVSTYKITSVPDASHGLLYLCKPGCSAINVNQFIDVADANKLRFDPSAYAVGLFAMFNYAAVDDDGEQGNTATYNIPFTGGATVLPVQLVAFDAILNDDQTVDLSWVTASEMNSS